MADRNPQNPVFAVDAAALDACLPKALCPACSTVIAVRPGRSRGRLRCPGCGIALLAREAGGQWVLEQREDGVARPADDLRRPSDLAG